MLTHAILFSLVPFSSVLASPALSPRWAETGLIYKTDTLSPRCADALASESRPTLCVIPSKYAASNGTADDSAAINVAFARCSSDSVIVFQEGVDYNVFNPVTATNLSNVAIAVQGNLHLPQNISYVQSIVNGTSYVAGNGYWFTLRGPKVDYVGTSNVNAGWIYSYGQAWWDANKYPNTGLANRPHLVSLSTTDGSVSYFKSAQPIAWNLQVTGDNITIRDTFINAFSISGAFPFNTDGFDITGTNINIYDSTIFNGDDAIAVQSGSHNVLFQGGTIGYQTHGMSIGSLGQNQGIFANVSNITFNDITVNGGVYAARFKSWQGGQGLAQNISWTNIRISNVTFPIFVTQTYINQGSSQTQLQNGSVSNTERPNNSSVNMQHFRWTNFTGTINEFQPGDGSCASDPCWYNVGLPNLTHTESVIVECNSNSSCQDFSLEGIQVVPQTFPRRLPTTVCIQATEALNPELGFLCRNGTFIPT